MMVIDDRLPSKQYIKARIEDNVKDGKQMTPLFSVFRSQGF
jgi:hypothetical protein